MGICRPLKLPPYGPQRAAQNQTFQIFNRKYELLEAVENKGAYPALIGNKIACFAQREHSGFHFSYPTSGFTHALRPGISGIIPLSRNKKTCPSTNTFATSARRATSASSPRAMARPNARNAAASARRFNSPLSQRARATALQLQAMRRPNQLPRRAPAAVLLIRVGVTEEFSSFSSIQLPTSNFQDAAATSLFRRESRIASRRAGVLVSRILNLMRNNFHTGACHA